MAERFEIDLIIRVFDTDTELATVLTSASLYPMSTIAKEDLAELLIDENSYIVTKTARELLSENYLRTNISSIIGGMSNAILLQIYYTYKYSAIKIFFRQNYKKYIPEYDYYQITSNQKSKLFAEACMREYDRFTQIIDRIGHAQNINEIPNQYLNYLAQLIGYQREDYLLLTDASFRELLKNIIDIYKIKGSNYSFELFFNFLGFDITVHEYWFDKRYGNSAIASNEYTGSTDKLSYLFYMTPIKPTDGYPEDMTNPYIVNENEITAPKNLLMFNQYTSWYDEGDSRGYSYNQLIGDTTSWFGDTYTFFKTNVVQYSLSSLGSDQEPDLDANELEQIEFYAKFLTPIYCQRQVSVVASPALDSMLASGFVFLDTDRSDPIYKTQVYDTKEYGIISIDANLGDTLNGGDSLYDPRAKIIVTDPNRKLYDWVHQKDYIYVTGDTSIIAGDTNAGNYFVTGDTTGDSYKVYNSILGRTTLLLKGPLPGDDQAVAKGYIRIGGLDSMFHLYEGDHPARYYWGDSLLGDSWYSGYGDTKEFTAIAGSNFLSFGDSYFGTNHTFSLSMHVLTYTGNGLTQRIITELGDSYVVVNPSLDSGDSYGQVFKDKNYFSGHLISGFYTDTNYAVYGDTNAISAINVLSLQNPTWDSESIFEEINRLNGLGTTGLFKYEGINYKVIDRDLLVFVDSVKSQFGDSTHAASDPFVIGDSYLITEGDSKSRLYLGDTVQYRSTGDTWHEYVKSEYVMIDGSHYRITEIGDTYIEISPWFEGGASGFVQKIKSWFKYYQVYDTISGDTIRDSITDYHVGFINPVVYNSIDLSSTGPITLGSNLPIEDSAFGKAIEEQTIDSKRHDYWKVVYENSIKQFMPNKIITGDSTGSQAWVLSDNGDSSFNTINYVGDFTVGEKIDSGDTGDTAYFVSITKYTDQRGLITFIASNAGIVHVYDPCGDTGDSWLGEYQFLTGDDFVRISGANDEYNNGVFRVSSTSRPLYGDTVLITLANPLYGDSQLVSGGYVYNEQRSAIVSIDATNGNIVVSDMSRRFNGLVEGDTIEIKSFGDSAGGNDGLHTVGDSIFHIRTGDGDTFGTTTFNVTTTLDEDGANRGYVKLYNKPWTLGDSTHQTGFEYLEFIKIRN